MTLFTLLGLLILCLKICHTTISHASDSSSNPLKDSPYKEIHENDCLIKCYASDNSLTSVYSGTYVTTSQEQPFILTTGHIQKSHHMTVSFKNGSEYSMEEYTPLFQVLSSSSSKPSLLVNQNILLQSYAGIDIGIGFIPSYKGSIKPARLLPIHSTLAASDTPTEANRKEFLERQNYLESLQEYPCSLSGFGKLISSSRPQGWVFPISNHDYKQSMMTMKVSCKPAFSCPTIDSKSYIETYQEEAEAELRQIVPKNVPLYYLDAHYHPQSTPYDQPIRQGFSGASLKTKEGYVIGVASSLETGFINDEAQSLSSIYRPLRYAYQCSHGLYTSFKHYKTLIFLGTLISSFIIFDGEIVPTIIFSTLFIGILSWGLDQLFDLYTHKAILPGARSFFSPTVIWEPYITNFVHSHGKNSRTSFLN